MDPRDVLAPAGHRPADAEPKRRQHLLQRAAVAVEHDAGAHDAPRACRAPSPCAASASHSTHTCARKSLAGRRVLVQRLLAVRAVVADRRGADQRARARLGLPRAPASRLRVPVTRLSRIARLALRAPALGDVLAGQVHDRVAALQRRAGRGLAQQVPGERLDRCSRARVARARAPGRARARVTCAPRACSAAISARADQARRSGHRHAQPLTRLASHTPRRARARSGRRRARRAVIVSPCAKPTSWPAQRGARRRAPARRRRPRPPARRRG